jgi:hypothetical protein
MPLGDMNQYLPGAKVGPYSSHPFTLYNTFTVGRDNVGHDVKFFGATTGKYFLWDESADAVVLAGGLTMTGNAQVTGTLTVGVNDTGHDVTFYGATSGKKFFWDESADTCFLTCTVDIDGTVTVGVNDTGYDVTFYGATAGASLLWDESADQLIITGNGTTPGLKLAGAGSVSPAAYTGVGSAWADGGTPDFAADQMYIIINVAGTLYRIPLWANS